MKKIMERIEINNSSWFRHWFDSTFYHKLYANRNEQEAAAFIDELIEELRPPGKASILDLGCGNGRHSKYLASKGFKVTGIDLAASSIRAAKKDEIPSLQFYRHDMRMPFGKNCFDFVFNFFTSFGYFKNDLENYQVVHNIADSLTTGGMLVMDYLNVQTAEKNLLASEKKEIDGIVYHINRWTNEKFIFKKITIEDLHKTGPLVYIEQVAKFNLYDFDLMFKRYGFRIEKVYGNYSLDEYNPETSPRLIILAKKSRSKSKNPP